MKLIAQTNRKFYNGLGAKEMTSQ